MTIATVGGGVGVPGGRPPNMENDIVKDSVCSTSPSLLIGMKMQLIVEPGCMVIVPDLLE